MTLSFSLNERIASSHRNRVISGEPSDLRHVVYAGRGRAFVDGPGFTLRGQVRMYPLSGCEYLETRRVSEVLPCIIMPLHASGYHLTARISTLNKFTTSELV